MKPIFENWRKFITQAESHLRSKYGCKKCADEMMDMPSKLTQEGAKKKKTALVKDRIGQSVPHASCANFAIS